MASLVEDKLKVGLIGTGKIAPAYVRGIRQFPDIVELVACSDINLERAKSFANDHNLIAMSNDELLASSSVDIVVNLTIPAVHAEVSLSAIEAGKHVHTEKPLATTREDGEKIMAAAKAKGVRIGCAPDTFLGGGIQTSRKLLDDGVIGQPVAAAAFFAGHGPEAWHPNPAFFYQFGGGPMFDLGPYYLTALVALLGPVAQVSAITGKSFSERLAGTGDMLQVDVNTHFSGSLRFKSGALASVITSFDIWAHNLPRIEIYGSEGTLSVPDPNTFKGPVKVYTTEKSDWEEIPLTHSDTVQRGIGVADLALAVKSDRAHLASGNLGLHVLDIMQAFDESSTSGVHIDLTSTVERPAALPVGLQEGQFDN